MSEISIGNILNGTRLPISQRLNQRGGLKIEPLTVDNYIFPMHTTYLFDRKKVYTQEPSRGLTGQMQFSEKFFVPYFTVTYNVLPLQEYSAMMQLLEKDEVTVKYYDTFSNIYRTSKFYAQQPEVGAMQSRLYSTNDIGDSVGVLDKIIAHEMRYSFVQNVTIVFAGTHSIGDIGLYSVKFSQTSGVTSQDYFEGEEFVFPEPTAVDGKAFKGWNSAQDGSGVNYAVGAKMAVASNLTFYAIWQ